MYLLMDWETIKGTVMQIEKALINDRFKNILKISHSSYL